MMTELTRFNWRAFDIYATLKVAIGLGIMLALTTATGEPWLATALVAMFAWLANIPGALHHRVGGMLAFGFCAAALTVVYGIIALSVPANVLVTAVVAFMATAALGWGLRAFMVGFAVICWAIYGPLMVASTSVQNCLQAVALGTGIVILLNIIGDRLFPQNKEGPAPQAAESFDGPQPGFILAYSVTVAAVLALATYLGWVQLTTDPSLIAGGAFFVIGFDTKKTWIAGLGRVLGLIGGVIVGISLAQLLGPGLPLTLLMIIACGASFGAGGVHPGAWMFFFMIFVAMGWPALDQEAASLTIGERFYGESVGIGLAMVAIVIMQWWQSRQSK